MHKIHPAVPLCFASDLIPHVILVYALGVLIIPVLWGIVNLYVINDIYVSIHIRAIQNSDVDLYENSLLNIIIEQVLAISVFHVSGNVSI